MTFFPTKRSDPSTRPYAVTPSDSADLPFASKQVYVGGAGDVALIGADVEDDNTTVIFKAVPVGTTLNVAARRILATGTTATNIVAMS